MKCSNLTALALSAVLIAPAASWAAAPKAKVDLGQQEYMEKCALCHGRDGKGAGGVAELLKKSPTDLTQLAKRNGGVFPHSRVYEVIDGRVTVVLHGDRDMPIWGKAYNLDNVRAAEYYADTPPYDMEMFARARILSLIDYLYRIQVR